MTLPKLVILSPCFYPTDAPAELMMASARTHKLNAKLYGVGLPFIPHGADAQVAKLYDIMAQRKQADLVLVTDCRDVLFLAGEHEIVRNYEAIADRHNVGLVMSAEQGCWPSDPEAVKHYYRPGGEQHGYDYPNAGQFIGEWDYVADCLALLLKKYRGSTGLDNSQGWWMQADIQDEVGFALDTECRLFQSMSGMADGHTAVIDRVLHNKVTGTRPCSVHFNGNPGNDVPQREMYWRLFR